ncbi:lipopolysaccharide assembly protein LapB [Brachyspira sp.]|uniref:tetratricopeptide repeat protein n=1 Tax=Brachyspira sp. TaxID=1977261 RepID=UPI00261E38F7|nr:CDC27 family protein [Brachyspira sp.]
MKKNIFKRRLSLSLLIFLIYSFSAFSQNTVENALKLYGERKYEDSIRVLESINVKPSDLDTYLLLIDNYIKLNNFVMAETLISDAERYHSRNYRLFERKLNIELINNRNSEARTTISTIKKLDSKNYFANYAEGVLSERAGYYKTAMSMYERARVINRVRPEATVALAYLYLAKGSNETALNLFDENITNNPRLAESYYHLANYHYLNKQYNSALDEVNNSLFYYTNYSDAKILKANIFISMNKYDDAIAILDYMPDTSFPNNSKYYYIGNVYEGANNYLRAKNSYINYLRTKPEDELGRLAYERVLLHTNPTPDYERDRAALYYANLASYYSRLADNVRAQAYLKHMLRLNPANTFARLMLSDVYRRMGLEEKSLEELEIAKNVNPEEKSIIYKYDSYKRKLDKNIVSKSWGIDQYNIETPGFTVAIADTITAQKDSPMFLNTSLYQTLSYVLPQFGRFKVLDIYTNYYDTRDLYRELNNRNVDYYLKGSTFQNNDTFTIMLDLVDVKSEKVITNFTVMTKGREKIMGAAVMTGRVINNIIPFYSKVIKIHNDNIYINAGRRQGITNNMNLLIYDTVSAATDLASIGYNSAIGMLKVITADENVSLAKLIDGRLLNKVNLNQIVMPYITNTAAQSTNTNVIN